MSDRWSAKLETYLDGELSASETREMDAHVRSCPSCAASVLSGLQTKRAIHSVGKRYSPSPQLRESVRRKISHKPQRSPIRIWLGSAAAFALLLIVGFVATSLRQQQLAKQHVFSELADLHVATLASTNPVDVISTDRHTVKPWFQGKIPFSFNLPELQNSEFTLLGGRVTYLGQTPGAELIYQLRKHQISVFIVQDRAVDKELGSNSYAQRQLSFNIESWNQDGLRYFVIGDTNSKDIHDLADLLKKAI
jgi:anti-sigma factor RsiW